MNNAAKNWLSRSPGAAALLLGAFLLAVLALVGGWHGTLGDFARQSVNTPAKELANVLLSSLLTFLLFVVVGAGFDGKRRVPGWAVSDGVFLVLVAAVVVSWRWHLFGLYELNTDESQDIAAALTLRRDPRYWFSADTGTHGPLVSLVLLIPSLFGLVPDYGSARLTGALLVVGCLYAAWRILSRYFPENLSRLLIAPGVLGAAWTTYFDFSAYNGEYLVNFLVALTALLGVKAATVEKPESYKWAAFAGFAFGLMPYAKIQGLPIVAAVLACTVGFRCLPTHREKYREAAYHLLAVAAGALLPTVFVLLYVSAAGVLEYFVRSFILWTLTYASGGGDALLSEQGRSALHIWTWPLQHLDKEHYFRWAVLSVVLGGAGFATRYRSISPAHRLLCLSAVVVYLSAYFCVVKPQRDFHHYLTLLFVPGWFLNAALWGALLSSVEEKPRLHALLMAAFVLLNLAVPAVSEARKHVRTRSGGAAVQDPRGMASEDDLRIAARIRQEARPGDLLVVWGWSPKYHVLTGLPQATRDGVIGHVIAPGGKTDAYFLGIYLADLDRNRPRLFVDAVGASSGFYKERALYGPEIFPEVARRLRDDYTLVEEIADVRIFVRK